MKRLGWNTADIFCSNVKRLSESVGDSIKKLAVYGWKRRAYSPTNNDRMTTGTLENLRHSEESNNDRVYKYNVN